MLLHDRSSTKESSVSQKVQVLTVSISSWSTTNVICSISPATGAFEKRATPLAAGGMKSRRDVKGFFSNAPVAVLIIGRIIRCPGRGRCRRRMACSRLREGRVTLNRQQDRQGDMNA